MVSLLGLVNATTSSASDYDTPAYDDHTSEPTYPDTSTSEPEPSTDSSSEATSESRVPTTSESLEPNGGVAEPVAALDDHPLLEPGQGAVNTSCELPPFATDVASQDAFYQAALPCLMDAWTPALENADLPAEPPNVITTDSDITSPCGNRGWNSTAMYCPGNHTIYMTARYYAETEGRVRPGVYLGQFAHEFGHAMQGMSGIMSAYGTAQYEEGGSSTPGGLEMSRRVELQATCFEGQTLAALQNGGVSNDYIFAALEDSALRGDTPGKPPDHGSLAANKTWLERGFYENRLAQCNTWSAPTSAVE